MIYSTTIGALFLKDFVVRKTSRLYNSEIWVSWTVSKGLMSQFVDDFWFVWNKLDSKSSDWIKKLARFFRFLLVLIQVLITYSLKYFSRGLIFKRSCKFHEFHEFFSKWKQQLLATEQSVRRTQTQTLSVFTVWYWVS